MAKKELPEINASSLADIAFLLLTFFLIATSMDKTEGITRKVPNPLQVEQPIPKKPRNVLEINIAAAKTEVLVKEVRVNPLAVHDEVIKHILNNGDGSCADCVGGASSPNYSENPQEAVLLIRTLKGTPLDLYLTVQNEIEKAYNEVWDNYSKRAYGVAFKDLDPEADAEKILVVKEKFPMNIGEAPPKTL